MNCVIVDDDKLSRNVIEKLVESTDNLTLIKSCENAFDAYNILQNQVIDLVFLDIEMPEINGMEFIKNLKVKPLIILITSYSQYALESYEHDVVDFLVKPVSPARFLKGVSKAWAILGKNGKKDGLFIKSGSELVQVNQEEILLVEALGNYVILHTPKKKLTVHTTMKEMEEKLSNSNFVRVHRSFIVNLKKIDAIKDNEIKISDKRISIGKIYKEDLVRNLNFL